MTRGVEQAGDDGQLDEGGERDAGRKSGGQREPVVPAVVADQECEHRRRETPMLPTGN